MSKEKFSQQQKEEGKNPERENAGLKEKKIQGENVYQKFEEHFGLSSQDLEKIPYFAGLEKNQQSLVLNYMEQDLMANIEIGALEQFQKETAVEGRGILEKTLSAVKKSPKIFLKRFYIPKIEKEIAQKKIAKTEEEKETHIDKLKEISTIVKEGCVDMEVNEKGETLNYLGNIGKENLEEEDQKIADEFNRAAKDFVSLSLDWDLKNKKKFSRETKIEERYNKSKKEVIALMVRKMESEGGDPGEVLLSAAKLDEKINLDRFFKSFPDVEKKLSKVKSQSVFWKGVFGMFKERGGAFAAGFGVRAVMADVAAITTKKGYIAATSILGWAAAPLSGALIGGYFARKNAIERQKKEISIAKTNEKEFIEEEDLDHKTRNNLDNLRAVREKLRLAEEEEIRKPKEEQIKTKESWEKSDLYKLFKESEDLRSEIKKSGFDLKIYSNDRIKISKSQKEVLNFVEADQLSRKLKKALIKLREADWSNQEEIKKLKKQLGDRIYYTQQKINSGTVKFYSPEYKLSDYFDLNQTLAMAESEAFLVDIAKKDEKITLSKEEKKIIEKEQTEDDWTRSEESAVADLVKKRLSNLLELRDERIRSQKEKQILWQTIRGALMSAGFAYLGARFRDVTGFTWKKLFEKVGIIHSGAANSLLSSKMAPSHGSQLEQNITIAETSGPASKVSARIVGQDVEIEVISKGGNLWDMGQKMVKDGRITKEEFWKGWRDSRIKLADVSEIPVSQASLIHEKDLFIFNKQTGLFEISPDSGQKVGSDRDLYEIYQKQGKKAPDWLEEKFGFLSKQGENIENLSAEEIRLRLRALDDWESKISDVYGFSDEEGANMLEKIEESRNRLYEEVNRKIRLLNEKKAGLEEELSKKEEELQRLEGQKEIQDEMLRKEENQINLLDFLGAKYSHKLILQIDSLEKFDNNLSGISKIFSNFSLKQQYDITQKYYRLIFEKYNHRDHDFVFGKAKENEFFRKIDTIYNQTQDALIDKIKKIGFDDVNKVLNAETNVRKFLEKHRDTDQENISRLYKWVLDLTDKETLNKNLDKSLVDFIGENFYLPPEKK